MIQNAKDKGLTRIELRFEHLEFKETAYYGDMLNNAACLLEASMAIRIQPVPLQWATYMSSITDCCLFIEERTNTFIIAWSQCSFQQYRV